ncbi:MAG TPA: histidine kinase [Gemmatirosa sp.]
MFRAPALTALVHLAGFGTGATLYAMLGLMALRSAPARTGPGPAAHADRLPVATALLGVAWNGGALVLYSLHDLALAPVMHAGPWLTTLGVVAFAALGFLPAVAVQAAAQPVARRVRRAMVGAAYALSAMAAAQHAWAAVATDTVPSRAALLTLTVGYVAVLPVLALALRHRPGGRAPFVAAALAAFAVAALHLRHHTAGESLVAHVLGDHASLPLALVVLYQDYRVAFADLFLKRALAALALVAAAVAAYLVVVVPFALPRLAADPADPLGTVLLACTLGSVLALAPRVRRAAAAVVDRVILHRPDAAAVRRALAAGLAGAQSAEAILDAVSAHLAAALGAGAVTWEASAGASDAVPATSDPAVHARVSTGARGREATVVVPVADAPGYLVHVGALPAGRRLLSDDLALLEWAALLAARRIDLVRVAHERYEREARERETAQLAAEAELRALRAQLNPHFLFNALTTIGYLVQTAPDRAIATLYDLTGLLRAVLRPTTGHTVPLADELAVVEAYLAIERARFEERLLVVVDVDAAARAASVPPLLVQPLVENAVQHGIAPLTRGGEVRVWARVEGDGARASLHVRVSDTGAGADARPLAGRGHAGFGLQSVERRLDRLYGAGATFRFTSRAGAGTTVDLHVPLAAPLPPTARLAGGRGEPSAIT